jgi:FecR protein
MLRSRSWMFSAVLILVGCAALGAVTSASGQARVGVVTALEGTATATRASTAQPVSLAQKDAVFLRDRIATRERSLAQLLLGGKALVTLREWSSLTINETPRTATVELGLGRLAIAVAKDKMRYGDTVEIRTPNCVVGIRGTVVVAEVTPAPGSGGATSGSVTTTVTVLRGIVEVTQLDPTSGRPVGTPLMVGPLGRVETNGRAPLRSQTITPRAAQKLGDDFRVQKKDWPTATSPAMVQHHIEEAQRQAAALAPVLGHDPKSVRTTATRSQSAPSALPTTVGVTGASQLGSTTSSLAAPVPVGPGSLAPSLPVIAPVSPVIAPVLSTTLKPLK